ncbi:MAG: hypothetical protein LBR32_10075 [Propionibacteriaceae bacterium]|jgi:hypothetical protein|nr:hypothetical protein [Propionibacteriaceae bacterium]
MAKTMNEAELTKMVKKLVRQVSDLQFQVKALRSRAGACVPEEHMVAIAAAVAAYLGYEGDARQPHFNAHSPGWDA